ncbi:MAG TPA: DUF4331 family protein [Candidatus Limnocylindrales bacterium]
MRKPFALATIGTALVVLTVGAAPLLTSAADHLDAPALKNDTDHSLDITDVYAFNAANNGKTVLVMNVNPLAGVVSGKRFSTSGVYRFNLSRGSSPDADLNDAKDRVYKVRFDRANANGRQPFKVYRNGDLIGTGKTGLTSNLGGGARIWAGVRDDPFFFDLAGYNQLRDSTYTDASGLTDMPGDDFFAGTNISTIVLEIPDSWVGAKANFWATTRRDGDRIDRMGKPALNTVFVDPFKADPTDKDRYNRTRVANDPAKWGGLFETVLEYFGNSPATADAIRGLLLPDMFKLTTADLGKANGTSFTGDKAGNILNGRTLAEDVIDFELFVVTGGLDGHAILTTDNVGANDASFMTTFPYLAPAH